MIRRWSPTRLAAFSTVLLALAVLPARMGAAQESVQPLPPDGTYAGLKVVDWAVAFYQWFNSIPESASPIAGFDETGVRAGVGQRAPVWFVPPAFPFIGTRTFTMVGTRTFTVPEGQAILFHPLGSVASARAGTVTEDQLLTDLEVYAEFLDHVAPQVSLDGVPIPNLKQYRVKTPLFGGTYPPDNTLDIPVTAGEDARFAAVGDGLVLLFPPLSLGKHVLHFQSGPGEPIKVDWTFHLIVQKPNEPLE
jgi:hypothetical protein